MPYNPDTDSKHATQTSAARGATWSRRPSMGFENRQSALALGDEHPTIKAIYEEIDDSIIHAMNAAVCAESVRDTDKALGGLQALANLRLVIEQYNRGE